MLRLKEIRISTGLSSREAARQLDIAPSTMSLYENEKRQPDYQTLIRIADFFGVTIDYLLGRDSEQKNNPDADIDTGDEIYSIVEKLTPENREKLLELARLYRDAQPKSEEN